MKVKQHPTVHDVRVIETRGPWATKSRAVLTVTYAIPLPILNQSYFHYEPEELSKIPPGFEIRGLRTYMVRGIPLGTIGATEFHRIREEMVFVLDGKVRWKCEDVYGRTGEFVLDRDGGIWMPPYILHEYEALVHDSGLMVVANTMFDPADPRTHDSYPVCLFRELQRGIHQ